MEGERTKCLDCKYVNNWYSFKWASTQDRQEHNRINRSTCISCKSDNVISWHWNDDWWDSKRKITVDSDGNPKDKL